MVRHVLVVAIAAGWVSTLAETVVRDATPVPFDTGRKKVVFEQTGLIHLGTGRVSHVAIWRDRLAVSVDRTYRGEVKDPVGLSTAGGSSLYTPPRTGWFSLNAVDIYRVGKDAELTFITSIPLQNRVRLLQFGPRGGLFIGDTVGVTAYGIDVRRKLTQKQWTYAIAGLEQIIFLWQRVLLRSEDCMHIVQGKGRSSVVLRELNFLPSSWLSSAGLRDRYLITSGKGECNLYYTDPRGKFHFARTLPLLGDVQLTHPVSTTSALVMDREFGLRVFNMMGLTRDVRKKEYGKNPRSFEDPRFVGIDLRKRYVLGQLALEGEILGCEVFGDRVVLVGQDGNVSAADLDRKSGKFGDLARVDGLEEILEVAGDKDRQVAVSRDGSVFLFSKELAPKRVLTPVETGPWFLADGKVFVSVGGTLRVLSKGALGPEVFQGEEEILDIQTSGDLVYVLSAGSLTCGGIEAGKWATHSSVTVPKEAHFFRVGPGYGAIVHGERGLIMVDLGDPTQIRLASHHELEMVTHSEVPTKTRDHLTYRTDIRDVLVEKGRVFVLGTEVFVYGLNELLSADKTVRWRAMWHRPYVSADDIMNTSLIARLGDGRYLVANRRFFGIYTRFYVLTERPDGGFDWRYSRLGGGNTWDLKVMDGGLCFLAAGQDGLRALQFSEGDHAAYLGSEREPGTEYQAVLTDGQTLYAKCGNTIRSFNWRLEEVKEQTAFTFAPQGEKTPKVSVGDVDITSEAYKMKMGYRNRLRLVPTDLSDDAGFPAVKVEQGTVAIDSKLGRLKFADGRNEEPKFVSRCEYINVGLGCWRKVGRYHIAAMSEQSQGFGVLDLSDPTRMKLVAVTGQPNWFTYPHTIVGYRDGFAYMTGNMFNTLIPVDMTDPLKPHYERMINMESGAVTKFTCPTHYAGFFRGDRLFVPCSEGLVEVDVSDPSHITRVTMHERARLIHQVFPETNRAVRWEEGHLEYLDITNVANPKVLGSYPEEGTFEHKKGQTLTEGDRTYILATNTKRKQILVLVDCSDWTAPKLGAAFELPKDAVSFIARDGYVYVTGTRSFYVVDWRRAGEPKQIAGLGESAFLGTWYWHFKEDEPRATVVAGGRYGSKLHVETMDGNTVWMTSNSSSYAVDVSDPARPKVVGAGPGFGESWWIRSGESQTVMIGSYRHNFIDISNPGKPKCVMEYYAGHPLEVGWPCLGDHDRYEVSRTTLKRWYQDPKDGLFRFEKDVVYPIWFGPDSDYRYCNRTLCHIAGLNLGRNSTLIESDPLAVTEGERLVLNGLIRTLGYHDRLHIFDRSRTYENERTSAVEFSVRASDSDRAFFRITRDESDGVVYSLGNAIGVPKGVKEVVLGVQVRGYGWLGDLQVLRGPENLLKNGNFDAPLDDRGLHPGWNLVKVAGGGRGYADQGAFYLLRDNDLHIYELGGKSRLPVSKIPAQIHPTSDSPVSIYVRQGPQRKVAYVITYQGLVTIDVTDPKQPAKLGAMSIPWFSGSNQYGSFSGDLFVVSQGYGSNKFTEGFYVIDVSDPATPRLRSQVTQKRHSGTVCHNGYVIVGDYNQGMQIWDITDPDRPKMVTDQGFQRCSQIWSIDYHGNHVLRNEVGGLELWEAPCRAQAPEGKVTVRF